MGTSNQSSSRSSDAPKNALVIVESPAKAKTISKHLGPGFRVESSIGHIRDLPSRAADIPARYKKEPWARLGVNVERDFEPLYIVPTEKKAQVKKLKEQLAKADALYLATDEDREGEAIAWHLREVLKPKVPVKRMVFGEITKAAIQKALGETRDIDERLVDAQEARRLLDRLYGYEVSPVLWKKVKPRLSAGRVQSVATRLVVDRERARLRFVSADYCSITGTFEAREVATQDGPAAGDGTFAARLVELSGKRVATGRDFDENTGALKNDDKSVVLDSEAAGGLASRLEGASFEVQSIVEKPFSRKPYAPFITSTLQQEAGRKFRFGAQRTMRIAQGLYENGYITYMRTDSTQLSNEAVEAARRQVAERYGPEFLPQRPRVYGKKSKNAQEAHEAIRPAGETFRMPAEVKGELDRDAFKLYELIWKRTLASQMKNAEGKTTTVKVAASEQSAIFSASGRVIEFPGFLRVYVEGSDDPKAELEDQETLLPQLSENQALDHRGFEIKQHSTQPPARFTEASLVKELEERGIGRPSTYASIIQTIQDRGYVWRKGSALVPTFTAFAVTRLLEQHLGDLVDFDFTARMEDDLDEIASGEQEAVPYLERFYFGKPSGRTGLKTLISVGTDDIDAREICGFKLGEDASGEDVAVRVGRYGAYVQAGDQAVRATVPEDTAPDELRLEQALELLDKAKLGDQELGVDPDTGQPVFAKTGRFGDYVQLGEPELDANGKVKKGSAKPKMASLWPDMDLESLTLDQALMLLSFPREVGQHPETGTPITAQDGRFGPYLKMGSDSRSLPSHDKLATITLDEALAIFAQPKTRGRAQAPLAELGQHPDTDLPLVVKNGRFGPYVTDGVVNASLPKGRDPKKLTLDAAVELIAAREQRLRDQGKDPRAKKKRATRKKKRASK